MAMMWLQRCCVLVVSWTIFGLCYSDSRVYRDDMKCGAGNPAPNGDDAICPGECCSVEGMCGSEDEYCTNTDYRDYTPAIPTGPPLNITAHYLPIGNLVLVRWDPPAIEDRNAVIIKYKISYHTNKDRDNTLKGETQLNYYAVTNLEARTKYVFKVAAQTAAGRGPKSDAVSVSTPKKLSTEEQIYDQGYCGNHRAPNGEDAICPGGCCNDGNRCDQDCSGYITRDYRDLDLLSLPAVHGLSQPDGDQDDDTIPSGPPLNVQAQHLPNLHVILVTWDAPKSVNQNNTSVEYVIEWKEEWAEDRLETVYDIYTTFYVLKDVHIGTTYSFQVSSATQLGRGPTSRWARVRMPDGASPVYVFRDDGLCGPGYPAETGEDAICPGECCVHHRCDTWCGPYTAQDYRDLDLVALDKSFQPTTTPSPTYPTTTFAETVGPSSTATKGSSTVVELEKCESKPRRYDITDQGMTCYFRGWADVQGQGAANDYCRIVGQLEGGRLYLSCALAGTDGDSEYNFNSPNAGNEWFDIGHTDTWYMEDEDADGKDDYCRCVGKRPDTFVSCMKAGMTGFIGMYDFTPNGAQQNCHQPQFAVNPYLGPLS